MNLHPLAPRDVRALLLGGMVFVVVIGSFKGFPAWLSWRAEIRESAAELSLELESTRTAAGRLWLALDSAEARVARFREIGTSLLAVHQPAEASVALTDLIREAARLSFLHVEAIESRIDTVGGPELRRVVASLRAVGDVAGLAAVLYDLEGRRTLAIRELTIQPQDVETPNDAVERLQMQFTIEGLVLVKPTGAEP